ncbi:MAG: 16S rRNA (guanine(966)-N(2))-methyltransferase RsmD [Phototrophicales bacterium]|nr:16S rRNA (guanine(966)-N(2))-methyltransferase RsmD [Phototrophicales bacterium]
MPIRVIAGSAKGRKLKLVPGDTTRPVMDKVKEALFSIIGRNIIDASFLDLFAGTGSVGIEALSRGAERAVFVELERLACRTIEENLVLTGLKDQAILRRMDVLVLVKGVPPQPPFDYIYIAPPQYQDLWVKTLSAIDNNPAWLGEETTVIVQIDPSERTDMLLKHLELADERTYGNTLLLFYMLIDEDTQTDG